MPEGGPKPTDRSRLKAVSLAISMLCAEILLPPLLISTPNPGKPVAVGPAPAPVSCDRRISPATGAVVGKWSDLRVPSDVRCATLTPKVEVAGRVSPTSAFVLNTKDPMTPTQVRARLKVVPATSFKVKSLPAETGRSFEIRPDEALDQGASYRVTFVDSGGDHPIQHWAFRTDAPLRVVSTLPRDEATEVPLNTGIEIGFSHEGVEGVQKRFSISPKVGGRFETHGDTIAFVPKGLAKGTLYTVRLAPGASVPDTDHAIATEHVFRFETTRANDDGASLLSFVKTLWEARPSEAPVIGVVQYTERRARTLPVEVYRYANAEALAKALTGFEAVPSWAHYAGDRRRVSVEGLTRVASFTGRLDPLPQNESEATFRFPAALPQGHYVVRATSGGRTVHAFLQSTDLAGYSVVSGRSTLVWANDLATGAALDGARVRLSGRTLAATGKDGVAFFDTPGALKKPDRAAMIVAAGTRTLVIPPASAGYGIQRRHLAGDSIGYGFPGEIDTLGYWRFVMTDRHLYRPTDTVRLWGMLRPREGAVRKRPLELLLTSGEDGAEIARTSVTAGASGTFITQIPFEGLSPGGYTITVVSAGRYLHSTWFEVQDYVKPAYELVITPKPRALIKGQRATYEVDARFFEGTPVPELQLTYVGTSAEGKAHTDERGRARIGVATSSVEIYETEGSHSIAVRPTRAEEGDISASASVRVFPSARTLDGEAILVGTAARVRGKVHALDLARINAGKEKDYEDYRGAPAAGAPVRAKVTRTSYRQIDDGEYYDYISKRTEKRYRYEEERTVVGTFRDTTDAKGRFDMRFPANQKDSYEVVLSTTDAEGRAIARTTYVQGPTYSGIGEPTIRTEADKRYSVGETVKIEAQMPDGATPTGGKTRYLFHLAHLGLRGYAVREEPNYSFRFAEAFVPNVEVGGMLFDGEHLRPLPSTYLQFDQDTRALSVDVKPRGSRFAPGTRATLDVQVRDKAGRGKRAEVLLSAVDEAFYRLQGQSYFEEHDVLRSLYTEVSGDINESFESHAMPGRDRGYDTAMGPGRTAAPAATQSGQSGAGDAGGGATRSDFRDVGLFTRVTTGSDGRATAVFDLPDNLTSWRVNAIAVSEDLFAGSTVSAVSVGLPVFVEVGINSSYLTDDRPAVRVRAFGDAIPSGAPARFTLRAPTLSDAPITRTGSAFQPMDITLPPLRDGRHKITVEVKVGDATDRVEREIVVAPSRILAATSSFAEITEAGGDPPAGPADRPMRLILSDHNRGRYHSATQELAWSWGDRLDQLVARAEAQELLISGFDEPPVPFPAEFRPAAYQTPRGGISILTYSDDDLGVSARIAAISPDRFDRARLRRYFSSILDDDGETRRRSVTALWGLAALGDDVISDVRTAATGDLSAIERLMVGMAAAELGDDDAARAAYRKVLTEHGEERGQIARVNAGNADATIEATALAAWLGARVGDDLSARLFRYTREDGATDLLIVLEQVGFLRAALPALSAERVRFRYTVSGRATERTLERGDALVLRLTPSQRKSLAIDVLEGRLGAVASYEQPADLARLPRDSALTVERTISDEKDGVVRLQDDDLVKVTIGLRFGARALSGCTQVSDLLPSGLRPLTSFASHDVARSSLGSSPDVWMPYDVVGQRVSFCAYPDKDRVAKISYFARVIGTGTYTAEPVVASPQRDPSRVAVSTPTEVRIS